MDMAKEKNAWKANLIKELRETSGWTQAHLAEIVGVAERTIQRLEKDGIASQETWLGLAQAFDKKVSDFDPPKLSQEEIDKFIKKITILRHMETGKELLSLSTSAYAIQFDSPQPKNSEEASIFGIFFELIQDWGDIWNDIAHAERMTVYLDLDQHIKTIESLGYFVFVETKEMYLRFPANEKEKPMKCPIAIILITEKTNSAITEDKMGKKHLPIVYDPKSVSFR